jgi:hypothetical protein
MERVRLDFQRKESPLPRAGLLVLLLAGVVAVGIGEHYLTLRQSLSRWEATADQLEHTARGRGIAVSQRQGGDRSEEIRHANEVLRQLSLPWDQLFESIEASGSKDVALLSLAPDREKHAVRIAIEAKTAEAGLGYLRTLEARDIFQNVQIRSHQIQSQDPEKPIRFNLDATWKGLP